MSSTEGTNGPTSIIRRMTFINDQDISEIPYIAAINNNHMINALNISRMSRNIITSLAQQLPRYHIHDSRRISRVNVSCGHYLYRLGVYFLDNSHYRPRVSKISAFYTHVSEEKYYKLQHIIKANISINHLSECH